MRNSALYERYAMNDYDDDDMELYEVECLRYEARLHKQEVYDEVVDKFLRLLLGFPTKESEEQEIEI